MKNKVVPKLTHLLFYGLLLVLPFSNLSRLPFGAVAITLNDLILPILILSWLIYQLLIKKKLFVPPRGVLLLGFTTWALISLVYGMRYIGGEQFMVSALYWFRWAEYMLLFFITFSMMIDNSLSESKVEPGTFEKKTLILLLYAQITFVAFGFLQFIFFPNFSLFVDHGWDPHYYRLLSTFLDPNFAGMFITLGIILFGAMFLAKDTNIISRKILFVYSLFSLVAVVITFSRSSYVALIAAIGLLGIIKSRKLLLVFISFAVASFVFIPRVQTRVIGALEIDETARLRLDVYDRTFDIIRQDPWFGVGFNAFRYAQDREGYFRDDRGVNDYGGHAGAGSDSSILFILATTGIPGLVLFVMFGVFVFVDAAKMYFNKKFPERIRVYGLVIAISLISLFLHTQFVNSLFYVWIMEWYWILLGLMYGLLHAYKKA